ncbi:MAG: radical SAM protein [Phycisphaerales bacterium]|nr:radical SAM protein [Phycisphaerales bacterium]
MIQSKTLFDDIQRAIRVAGEDLKDARGFLANPGFLAERLIQGEQRRNVTMQKHETPIPRFAIVSVTWDCNLECTDCYASNYTSGNELSLDQLRSTLEQCIDAGTCFFIIVGGEPLMRPGLLELLRKLDDGLFLVFTNGTLLNEAHAQLFATSPNLMPIFSMEGSSHFTDSRRGAGVGVQIAEAMTCLTEHKVPFGISCMVTRENVSLVTSRAWFDEIWQRGVRFAFLVDYIPMEDMPEGSMILTAEDMADKQAALAQRWEDAKPLVVNFPPDEYLDSAPCMAAGRGMIHINADGFVEPCPFSHYAADNMKDKSYLEVLQGPFLTRLRNEVCTRPNPTKSCLLQQQEALVKSIATQTGGFCTEHLPTDPFSQPIAPSVWQ